IHGAAIPGVPIADTVKRVQPIEGTRDMEAVRGTVERAPLRAIQTPQAFRGNLLRLAHAEVTADVTDDASMIEHLGMPVVVVPGETTNMKITTPADLAIARVLLAQREE
ncbi:MAG: 2-C-methyl-D-erythritol 4-phosphate cytidylyltransferase, partial [Chloroflexi bacterium]|nr:2-C-methyl-D-erythritol 4-phosphate cytidylyltransferase [Chloroflexota bacterium]